MKVDQDVYCWAESEEAEQWQGNHKTQEAALLEARAEIDDPEVTHVWIDRATPMIPRILDMEQMPVVVIRLFKRDGEKCWTMHNLLTGVESSTGCKMLSQAKMVAEDLAKKSLVQVLSDIGP